MYTYLHTRSLHDALPICFTAAVTQPSPKLTHASSVVLRAPSRDHIAISTAPVSEPGTMPIRCVSGTFRFLRVRSIARRTEENTSELQPLMRISYAVFCLIKQIQPNIKLRKQRLA